MNFPPAPARSRLCRDSQGTAAEMSPLARFSFIKFSVCRRDIIEFHQTLLVPVADESSAGEGARKFACENFKVRCRKFSTNFLRILQQKKNI